MKIGIVPIVALVIFAGCGGSNSPSAIPALGQTDLPVGMTSGTWAGTGTIIVTDPATQTGTCTLVQMTVRLQTDSVHFESLNYNCDFFFSFYGPYDAEIRTGELWNSGERIGTIDSTGISVKISRLPGSLETFDLRMLPDGKVRIQHHEYSNGGDWKRTIDHSSDLTFQPQ
jgi:hypothetical protein